MKFDDPRILILAIVCLVPWLIRQDRRESVTRYTFSPLFLLLHSSRSQEKRRRYYHFFLLLCQTLLILFLVLFAAQPSFYKMKEETGSHHCPTPSSLKILVVDGSDSGQKQWSNSTASLSVSPADYIIFALNPLQQHIHSGNNHQPQNGNLSETETVKNISAQDAGSQKNKDSGNIEEYHFPYVERMFSREFPDFPQEQLSTFNLVILVDLSAPMKEEVEKLTRFLHSDSETLKHGLLVFFGSRTRYEKWNDTFFSTLEPNIQLLPAIVTGDTPFQGTLNEKHPLGEFFLQYPDCGLTRLPLHIYFPLVSPSCPSVLSDTLSRSVIMESQSGKMLFFSTVPDEAVSSLAQAPVFVPLLQKSVEYLTRASVPAKMENRASVSLSGLFFYLIFIILFAELLCQKRKILIPPTVRKPDFFKHKERNQHGQ